MQALQNKAYIDVRWVNPDGSEAVAGRRYRLGERVDLVRQPITVPQP